MSQLQATMMAMQEQMEEQAQQQAPLTNYVQKAEQQRAAATVPPASVAPTQPGMICGIDSGCWGAQTSCKGDDKTWLSPWNDGWC